MTFNNLKILACFSSIWRLGTLSVSLAAFAISAMACNAAAADTEAARIRAVNHLIALGVTIQGGSVFIPATARLSDDDLVLLLDIGHFDHLTCLCTTVTSQGIIQYLSKADGLDRISWHGPGVTDDAIAAMARLGSVESLDLRGPFRGTGLEPFAKGPIRESLQRLSLRTDEARRPDLGFGLAFGLKPQALVAITKLQQLRELSLSGCGITDRQLEPLHHLQNLRVLGLDGNPINGSDLRPLEGCVKLERLTLTFCRLTEYQLTAFPRLPELRHLDLSGNQINDTALAMVAAAEIPKLEKLYLNRTDVTDAGLQPLQRLDNLQRLSLDETRIDGSGLAALPPSRIHSLGLARTPLTADSLIVLSQFPHLRGLNVSGIKLGEDGLTALRQLHQLTYLNVSSTDFSDAEIEQLWERLGDCQIESRRDSVFEKFFDGTPGGTPATDY